MGCTWRHHRPKLAEVAGLVARRPRKLARGLARQPSVAALAADRADFAHAQRIPLGVAAVAVGLADLGHARVAAALQLLARRALVVAAVAAATAATAGLAADRADLADADRIPRRRAAVRVDRADRRGAAV